MFVCVAATQMVSN